MIRSKRWWSYRSSYATTQMHNTKPQTRHITTALHWQHEQHQTTKHSTQLDIAVRERAYFLWGSSPCLEWRVYTHNASLARRGGSPRQSAPPPGSPGSTGPGLLWCRTGKRRSPCYLQVEGRETDTKMGEIPYPESLLSSDPSNPFKQFYNPGFQTGAGRENKALLSANKWKSVPFSTWITSCMGIKKLPNPLHFN